MSALIYLTEVHKRRQRPLTFEARKTHLGHRTCQILQGQRIKAREKNKNRNKNWRQGKRVGTQKVRELEDHSGDVSDKQRQKQVQSTGTLESTALFIYSSKQTSCWRKPNMAARTVSFPLRSLHFTSLNVHICYIYALTFSSKSLICLLWISVLSSRSRILCKNRKKWRRMYFFPPSKEAEWAAGCILQGLPGEPGVEVPSSPGGSGSRTRDSSSASASSASPPPSAAHPSAAHPEVRHI